MNKFAPSIPFIFFSFLFFFFPFSYVENISSFFFFLRYVNYFYLAENGISSLDEYGPYLFIYFFAHIYLYILVNYKYKRRMYNVGFSAAIKNLIFP